MQIHCRSQQYGTTHDRKRTPLEHYITTPTNALRRLFFHGQRTVRSIEQRTAVLLVPDPVSDRHSSTRKRITVAIHPLIRTQHYWVGCTILIEYCQIYEFKARFRSWEDGPHSININTKRGRGACGSRKVAENCYQ
jgi:hypothetical protein